MTCTRVQFADYHDDHVFALPQVRIPSREQLGASKPSAPADLIRVNQSFRKPVSVLRQQIWMSLSDVSLSLLRHLHLTLQIRARVLGHRTPPVSILVSIHYALSSG